MVVNLRNIYDSLTISLRWVFRNLRRFGHKAAPVVPKPVDLTNSLLFIPECIFYILIVLNHLQRMMQLIFVRCCFQYFQYSL